MSLIGACGDNCAFCPRYVATRNGSRDEFEKVKDLWVRLGFRDPDFPLHDMACHGCNPENACAYPELRDCVSNKEIDNCGLCDVYPCELMDDTFDQTERLRSHAVRVCTSEEMHALDRAFFSKKKYLAHINDGLNEGTPVR